MNASDTLLGHVIAEMEMYGRAVYKILCQWIWNCCECCCKKQGRRGKLLSAERSSLLAGLVDTQCFSLWFSWMLSHTDKRLCDGSRSQDHVATAVSTLQALLPRGRSQCLKETAACLFSCQGLLLELAPIRLIYREEGRHHLHRHTLLASW